LCKGSQQPGHRKSRVPMKPASLVVPSAEVQRPKLTIKMSDYHSLHPIISWLVLKSANATIRLLQSTCKRTKLYCDKNRFLVEEVKCDFGHFFFRLKGQLTLLLETLISNRNKWEGNLKFLCLSYRNLPETL
jgi:hypothetical protein